MEPAARRAAACGTLHTARLDEAWGLKCGRVTQQHQPVLVMHICFELFLPTTTRSRAVGSPENQEGKVNLSDEIQDLTANTIGKKL